MRMDKCEIILIVWMDCMDGLVTISSYIVWTRPTFNGDDEWKNSNRKRILSIVWMDCVGVLV